MIESIHDYGIIVEEEHGWNSKVQDIDEDENQTASLARLDTRPRLACAMDGFIPQRDLH